MAKKKTESVYRVTEIIGTSTVSWEDAARMAVEAAARSLFARRRNQQAQPEDR
jgi:flavin-binding protein dodecin